MKAHSFRLWLNNKNRFADQDSYVIHPNGSVEMVDGTWILGDVVLEQYTSVHDKNSRPSYEGDICVIFLEDGTTCTAEIQWVKRRARFAFVGKSGRKTYMSRSVVFEVIGNIHEGVLQ